VAPGRVAIVSGSYGAGHDAAAGELSCRLHEAGYEVDTYDVAHLLPAGIGEVLKRSYYAQLRVSPGSWGTTLAHLEPGSTLHRTAVRLLALGTRRVIRAVDTHDLVIATHPFAAQILGCARRRGLLAAPAVTYLTDASVHPMWVHPAVDLHLAIHDVASEQARRWGGRTVTVEPLAPRVTRERLHGRDPLASLGIIGRRAVVTGGSLGIGELEQAARDILATGVMTPVVACGHNTSLRRRLSRLPGVVALGWRDDLPAILAASDCVVQNAGGFTCLEAMAVGTPVVSYRPIPGHGVTNAESLEQAGLASWARNVQELGMLLVSAIGAERTVRIPASAPLVVDVLTAPLQASREPEARTTGWRRRRAERASVA
jgi:processive 1,2-diacylglycerol beta-glucosyltransferase